MDRLYPRAASHRGMIDRTEIESSGLAFADAYDMVHQLRPTWPVARGVSTLVPNRASDTLLDYIAVYVDRNLTGDPESLRWISVIGVDTIDVPQYRVRSATGLPQPHSRRHSDDDPSTLRPRRHR